MKTSSKHDDEIVRADKQATRALAEVDASPGSQLATLRALDALNAACTAAVNGGVLATEISRLLRERKDAYRAFQLDRVARAVEKHELAGTSATDEALRAIEDAIFLLEAIDDDSGEIRTLRERLSEVKQGRPGKPRPFFARYLEHQKR